MNQTIHLFDTTLRDGTQGEKVAFSAKDKLRIAQRLDAFGIDYIEGGWPGSNPKDMQFFELARDHTFDHAKVVAFGSTCRANNSPEEDHNIQMLIDAGTPAVSIFGKSWLLHVEEALKIDTMENIRMIHDSVRYLKEHDKEVIYDAEHFFDGYKANPEYALSTIKSAESAGADTLVLCDTNGGTFPNEIRKIVNEVKEHVDTPLGIHAHNDCELAVANTLAAVNSGCVHLQGTVNGYGERCGNANLCSIIPNLQLKQQYQCVPEEKVSELSSLSRFVSEVANLNPNHRQPYVGQSAFAHKGGIHVSAVMKNADTYEHVTPESVGNRRRVLVSDLSGKSNIRYKSDQLGIDLDKESEEIPAIVDKLKQMENEGYQFEAAEASLELLVQKMKKQWEDYFKLEGFRIIVEKNISGDSRTEATIRLTVNGQMEHCAAEGSGPVHALDKALRKAVHRFYPGIADMHLQDYKVRVLDHKDGTDAKVRVLIDSVKNDEPWTTVGVSRNIIDASWEALSDSFNYYLANQHEQTHNKKAI
ncbi:citramalate synthase [Fodinibius halophilus]|uniref:Citramalate synthase n=1 Tax=Fodinibius halophilus TaxID=1736908 RepID=A0A6M1SZU8_9BACT|nr:citramalate synthase [Fodinibius halophilus]NGP87207.1 citramalate synthase [Fodinibius halophilus]